MPCPLVASVACCRSAITTYPPAPAPVRRRSRPLRAFVVTRRFPCTRGSNGTAPSFRLPPGWQSRRHPPPTSPAPPCGNTLQPLTRPLRVPPAPVRGVWGDGRTPSSQHPIPTGGSKGAAPPFRLPPGWVIPAPPPSLHPFSANPSAGPAYSPSANLRKMSQYAPRWPALMAFTKRSLSL